MDFQAGTMAIHGISITTPMAIRCGRTSVIRSRIITAPHAPGTVREPTIAIIKPTTIIKAKAS